jgi:hypothetical protein
MEQMPCHGQKRNQELFQHLTFFWLIERDSATRILHKIRSHRYINYRSRLEGTQRGTRFFLGGGGALPCRYNFCKSKLNKLNYGAVNRIPDELGKIINFSGLKLGLLMCSHRFSGLDFHVRRHAGLWHGRSGNRWAFLFLRRQLCIFTLTKRGQYGGTSTYLRTAPAAFTILLLCTFDWCRPIA